MGIIAEGSLEYVLKEALKSSVFVRQKYLHGFVALSRSSRQPNWRLISCYGSMLFVYCNRVCNRCEGSKGNTGLLSPLLFRI